MGSGILLSADAMMQAIKRVFFTLAANCIPYSNTAFIREDADQVYLGCCPTDIFPLLYEGDRAGL